MNSKRGQVLMTILSRVAWADGVLRPREAAFFCEVVDGLGLEPEARATALRAILDPSADAPVETGTLDEDDRRWLLGFGFLMSKVDGEIHESELAVLRSLASRFGVSAEDTERVFTEADSLRAMVPEQGRLS